MLQSLPCLLLLVHLVTRIFLICFGLTLGLFPAYGMVDSTQPTKTLSYAISLYQQGEYFRAITEFKRDLYQHPESQLNWSTRLWIIKSYYAGGETKQAIYHLEQELQKPVPQPIFHLYLGLALFDHHQPYPYSLRAADIKRGVQALEKVPPSVTNARYIEDFVGDWKQRDTEPAYSPRLAGGLSAVLPGSGSAYLGRWREASYAFLFTTVFAAAALQTRNANQPGLAALFGGFGLVFYGGNIYTAVNSAHKTNDQMQAKQFQRLRQKHGIFFLPHQPNSRF